MTYEDYEAQRWLAVYGALVALQVRDHVAVGQYTPTRLEMRMIVEEARMIADAAIDVEKDIELDDVRKMRV